LILALTGSVTAGGSDRREGAALGVLVGGLVGAAVGTGTSGVGLGDLVGLADGFAVGALDLMAVGGKVVRLGVGAMEGAMDKVGAVVLRTGDMVGAVVGDKVIFGLGGGVKTVGSKLDIFMDMGEPVGDGF
jgi:hypothetical protein